MIKIIALLITLANTIVPPKPKYDVDATALKIYADYKANKSKADAKYLNKRVFVHGVMINRSGSLWYIYLRIPDPEGMCVTVADDQLLNVPLYKIGDNVDLICTGYGLVFNLPLFRECRMP